MGNAQAGILTFHCSDNFGAMLQAYALKTHLNRCGMKTELVHYCPAYMTGRHWLYPKRAHFTVNRYTLTVCARNLLRLPTFLRKRGNMRRFRKKRLTKGQFPLYFYIQLHNLKYEYLILGSDQIWNPSITLGLKKAYFGSFRSSQTKKVVAYAASIGSARLDKAYDRPLQALLASVDSISLREPGSVPYFERLTGRKIRSVSDPVFFIEKDDWEKLERCPADRAAKQDAEYVLYYETHSNRAMLEYARRLARERQLELIVLENSIHINARDYTAEYTAGPEELLWYIHRARYVVTNSFHAAAMSVIYRKSFAVCLLEKVGQRLSDMLEQLELSGRILRGTGETEFRSSVVTEEIDWDKTKKLLDGMVAASAQYLRDELML